MIYIDLIIPSFQSPGRNPSDGLWRVVARYRFLGGVRSNDSIGPVSLLPQPSLWSLT